MNKILLNGFVPANEPCPFLAKCKFRIHICSSDTNIKTSDYYCRATVIHAKLTELDDKSANEVREVVEKRVPNESIG